MLCSNRRLSFRHVFCAQVASVWASLYMHHQQPGHLQQTSIELDVPCIRADGITCSGNQYTRQTNLTYGVSRSATYCDANGHGYGYFETDQLTKIVYGIGVGKQTFACFYRSHSCWKKKKTLQMDEMARQWPSIDQPAEELFHNSDRLNTRLLICRPVCVPCLMRFICFFFGCCHVFAFLNIRHCRMEENGPKRPNATRPSE